MIDKQDLVNRLEILYHQAARVDSKTRGNIPSWCLHSIEYLTSKIPSDNVVDELVITLETHETTVNSTLNPPEIDWAILSTGKHDIPKQSAHDFDCGCGCGNLERFTGVLDEDEL